MKCLKHQLEIIRVWCFAIGQMRMDSRGGQNHLGQDHLKAELIPKLKIQLDGIHAKKYFQKHKRNQKWLTVFLEGTSYFWKTWKLRSKSSASNNIRYWKKKKRKLKSSKSRRTDKEKKYKMFGPLNLSWKEK